tara:strand:+ start:1611 stop:3251 length:1641 start_codon:yes stop_codon:yes gene_type:complete
LDSKEIRVLVLSAGKIASELEKIFGKIPSGLIPLNGKPVIFRIIDKLLGEGIRKISITVGYKKEILEKIVSEQYKDQCNIEFIPTDFSKPPGNSIKTAVDFCSERKLLIILGDTLIDNDLSELIKKEENIVITSQEFIDSKNWCIVTKKDGQIEEIFDKEQLKKDQNHHAMVGCYFFNHLDILKKILNEFNAEEGLEISTIIKKLKEEENIVTELAQKWHDVGHLENYFSTKQFVLKTRYFNSLQFDDLGENVIKTSQDDKKLINEINWYKDIPNDILELVPKIKESDVSNNPFIKLEYVKHPTLSELWLYSDFPSEFWKKIIHGLLDIVQTFKKYKENVSIQEYYSIYFQKTVDRIDELKNTNKIFKKIFDDEYVSINGTKLKNWSMIRDSIEKKIGELYDKNDNCIIHGDLYFSNILYDSENNKYKLIDPRGRWGNGISGDIKYDIAKIRHSVVGGFDTIINGLYTVAIEKNNGIVINVFEPTNYQTISKELDEQIEKYWNLDEIKMIEGLLFISMLPLHEDNFERQLAFFAIGIKRLNEILGN